MLLHKICVTICLVVINSDRISGLNINLTKRSTDSSKPGVNYHSNHPPLGENTAPISIPVAIVYDVNQENLTTENTVTTYHPSFSGKNATVSSSDDPSSVTTASTTTTRKNSLSEEPKPSQAVKSRAHGAKEDLIPVVVVYDPVTDRNIKRNTVTEKSDTVKAARTRSKQRGRTVKPTEGTDTSAAPIPVTTTVENQPKLSTRSRTGIALTNERNGETENDKGINDPSTQTTTIPTTINADNIIVVEDETQNKESENETNGTRKRTNSVNINKQSETSQTTPTTVKTKPAATQIPLTRHRTVTKSTEKVTESTKNKQDTTSSQQVALSEISQTTSTTVKTTPEATKIPSTRRRTVTKSTKNVNEITANTQDPSSSLKVGLSGISQTTSTTVKTTPAATKIPSIRGRTDTKSPEKVNEITENTQDPASTAVKLKRTRDPVVPIVDSKNFVYAQTGEFHYSYEGGDGTKNFEDGKLKSYDDELTGESVSGGFSYKGKDGKDYSLTYTADENGYRPVGDHLPTPPPIPPAIARALKYLATKTPAPEDVTESLSESSVTKTPA